MPTLTEALHPDAIVPQIANCYQPPHGMECCVLTALLAMTVADRVPEDARRGIAGQDCWAREAGGSLWASLMVRTLDPWSHLRGAQSLLGGEIAIQATPSAPCPVLTPGRGHIIQRWLYGLESGGHTYAVIHAPEGETPYYCGTPLRVVQSSAKRGYTDRGETDWKIRSGSVFGVLTLPE